MVEEPPPALTTIQPANVMIGGTVTVTISGRGLDGARALTFEPSDVTASIVSVTATAVQARVTARANAEIDEYRFALTTPRARLESTAFGLSFAVLSRPPGYRSTFGSPVVGGDQI